jgi:hypothetical protein
MLDLMDLKEDDYVVKYPSWACRISTGTAEDGGGIENSAPPTLTSEIAMNLKPVKVSLSAGGQNMDYADLVWMIAEPLINRMSQPAQFTKMLDVIFPAVRGKLIDDPEWFSATEPNRRAILGDFTEENESVDQQEMLTGRIEVRPYLFGKTLDGLRVKHNSLSTVLTVVGTEIVFNPMVDGVVLGNMSSRLGDDEEFLWIDPEIGLSDYATAYHLDVSGEEWTLIEAIKTLCWSCNPGEELIENPTLDPASPIWTDSPVLKDIRMQSGQYLPAYLDQLLHPIGYNWYVDPDTGVETQDDDTFKLNKPKIVIFQKGYQTRGDNTRPATRELYFQPPGELLNLEASNVNAYDIRRRIGDSITAVRTLGDKLRAEVTLPIFPAWKADKDEMTASDLAIDAGPEYQENQHVHRVWAANEGGDLFELRESPDLYPAGEPPDFDDIFSILSEQNFERYAEKTVRRRRVLEPPLTFKGTEKERVRRDVLVEYSTDAGETWTEVTSKVGGFSLLPDQIGIIFTDNEPPSALINAFASGDLRMRITGTISSDHSLWNCGADGYQEGGAQGRLNRTTLNMPDRFRHWFVVGQGHEDRPELDDSPYKSVLAEEPLNAAGADVHDDRAAIIQFSKDIIKPMLNAEYDGNFIIPGWAHPNEYKIGDLITKINGREISLNQSAGPSPQFMQITGIEYELSDETGPQTRLIVDRGVREYVQTDARSQAMKNWESVFGGFQSKAEKKRGEL